jgi:hypothetical protein
MTAAMRWQDMGEMQGSDVRHPGCGPIAAFRKCSGSKHRSTSCLARNDVTLPSRVITYLECSASDRRAGERTT